eukprot:TRINITY_DN8553_c0_g1_i1.p1 TRINITY_DN8553_c0_g1~~TRINITY_DN8553_c0_g1_i1.p1  ORF type:complete len:106 (-),score=23.06 TRINITY_DN8553_c0_g1_i1:105-422(-)
MCIRDRATMYNVLRILLQVDGKTTKLDECIVIPKPTGEGLISTSSIFTSRFWSIVKIITFFAVFVAIGYVFFRGFRWYKAKQYESAKPRVGVIRMTQLAEHSPGL